jgi:hypothetical protein
VTTPRNFEIEISNQTAVVAAATSHVETAKTELSEAQANLNRSRTEEQKAFEKAHSGIRVESIFGGGFIIARGHYLDSKYFAFYVDGNPSWTNRSWGAMKFRNYAGAEACVKEILEANREQRAVRKAK